MAKEANVKQSLLYAKASDGAIYLLAMMPDGCWAILRDGLLWKRLNPATAGRIGPWTVLWPFPAWCRHFLNKRLIWPFHRALFQD